MSGGYQKLSGIYTITNTLNNKIYVGSCATSIKQRWNNHKNELLKNKHTNTYLQRSVNKYGINNFKFEVLEECLPEYCISVEQYWINMLDVCNKRYGYNIACVAGSSLGQKRTKQQRLNISNSLKGKRVGKLNPNYGKKNSESMKIKMLNTRYKNKSINIDMIYAINLDKNIIYNSVKIQELANKIKTYDSEIRRCLTGERHYVKNFIVTKNLEEIDKLINKAKSIKTNPSCQKGGMIINLITNEIIKFNGVRELANRLNYSYTYTHNILTGKKKTNKYKILKYGKI